MRTWTLLTVLASAGVGACGSPKATPSASAVASVETPPSASSEAPVEPPPPPPPAGPGATKFITADEAKCHLASIEVAQYLSRGELALATTPTEIALGWLVQGQGDAKIGVGAFDGQAKRVMRDRSIADTKTHGPVLYAGKDDWIVTWFEEDGLAFARTRKEPDNHYDIGKFSMMRDVPLDDLAIAQTPDGSFVAASPFATGGKQLTVFTFSSSPTSATKQSVGMTRSGTTPHNPVVAADADGFLLVWVESSSQLRSVRLDAAGKSSGGASTLLGPAKRTGLSLLGAEDGFYLTWSEGPLIAAVKLTKDGTVAAPPIKIGEGKWARPAVSGADLFVAYVIEGDKLVVVKARGGAAPTSGVVVADVAKDPPMLGISGSRLATFSTEPIHQAVATKRAMLRTVDVACIP
ncbi:MAG: hypothetical protein U0414_27565 [Polyangiaceae bacterium]